MPLSKLRPLSFYEFFAGGGMARLGLGEEWRCTFANEWSRKKAASYITRFGAEELPVCDVSDLTPEDLPGAPALVWASFPCQDLSLAGTGAGLKGERSSTFQSFWRLMRGLMHLGRRPRLIVLENVIGLLTSQGGNDFRLIVEALAEARYRVGALVVDAVRFLPQSRSRLFLVAVTEDTAAAPALALQHASDPWRPRTLRAAVERLPRHLQDIWRWWKLPVPSDPVPPFRSFIREEPAGVEWHTQAQTDHIISLMSPRHLEKLNEARQLGCRVVGTVYRRMRPDRNGRNIQRAEIRFDQISGCLRTPAGGSSRQTVVVVEGDKVRSRLLSPREAARLMGVPDDYPLPVKYNDAYHLLGDGLAVPAVQWLSRHLLIPLAVSDRRTTTLSATEEQSSSQRSRENAYAPA